MELYGGCTALKKSIFLIFVMIFEKNKGGAPPLQNCVCGFVRGVHPPYKFCVWCLFQIQFFSHFEGMQGTKNQLLVDLSQYGFVFKEFLLQSLILDEFLNLWVSHF